MFPQTGELRGKPVLLRVEYHGGLEGTAKQIQEMQADNWSFLLWQFGVPGFQPKKQ